MELISVVFPSGPVKVFDFLFCFFLFFTPPTPTTHSSLIFYNGGLSRAQTQSAGGAPLTPFWGLWLWWQQTLDIIIVMEVDPLVCHCHLLCAIRVFLQFLFFGLLPFFSLRWWSGRVFKESMYQVYPLVLVHCCCWY